jgi:small subunit ribosomal protein S3
MTHTVHPYVHRLGILRDWKSRWFATGAQYRSRLQSDVLIHDFLEKKLRTMHVSSIEVERDQKVMRIVIRTSRPGLVIGRSGEGIDTIRKKIDAFVKKRKLDVGQEIKLDIQEVKSAEADAKIVAQMVRDQLEKRMSFRRVLKGTMEKVMANRDVKGAKITIAGRLNGADMSRTEEIKKGQIPLQTFRADIDYAREEARMSYGQIGIKVWIYRGQIFEESRSEAPQRRNK